MPSYLDMLPNQGLGRKEGERSVCLACFSLASRIGLGIDPWHSWQDYRFVVFNFFNPI